MILQELAGLDGVTTCENAVRDYIIGKLGADQPHHVDKAGNLHVHNPGIEPAGKILLDAHMDELGVMVSGIDEDGSLRFSPFGRIYCFLLVGRDVAVGDKRIPGIFCRRLGCGSAPSHRDMYINIGCETREEAEKLCRIGDIGVFVSGYRAYGEGMMKARNFDDRAGCGVLLELLLERPDVAFTAVFTVREEAGLLGAKVAAWLEEPDYAICLEGGSAGDIPFLEEQDKAIVVGDGPALSVRNVYTIFDTRFLDWVEGVAGRHGIPIQRRRSNTGGCNGNAMQTVKTGAKTVTISVPCRYIHCYTEVGSRADYRYTLDLIRALLEELKRGADI